MKTSLALLSLYSLLELSSAFVIPNKQKREEGLVRIPLVHKQRSVPFSKRDGNGIANLYSDSPAEFAITINIGTPAQPVQVTLDTGSSDLVIPTTACSREHCSQFQLFDTTKSTTFSNFSIPMNLSYGIGNAIGYLGGEDVTIGGYSIKNQTVGFVTDLVDQVDGTFGLGYPALTANNYNPFAIQLHNTNSVSSFSIYFDKNATDKNNAGEIIFGGGDATKFSGNLISTPNIPRTLENNSTEYFYWDIVGQYMSISNPGGLVSNVTYPNSTDGVFLLIDTGSSYSTLPQNMIDEVISIFNASDVEKDEESGLSIVPCTTSFYNDYKITFGVGFSNYGITELTIPLADMIVQTKDNTGKTVCILGASPGDDHYILGLSVIHNFYMNFDFVKHQISFASAYKSSATVSQK
ncbi:acid protease [Backusella circina FSU 941]|nr:acid protease [Backusella circina FSU 941]